MEIEAYLGMQTVGFTVNSNKIGKCLDKIGFYKLGLKNIQIKWLKRF